MMQAYRYIARAQNGGRIEGTMAAREHLVVVDHLRARGLIAVEISADSNRVIRWLRDGRIGGRQTAILLFYRSLSILINAGLTLRRSLDIVGEQIDDPLVSEVIASLGGAVESGQSLATAMEMHQNVFTPLAIALIRAAEQSGQLSETLDRYAGTLERQRSLTRKIISAMAYPTFVLVCAFGLLTTLLVTILPTLASLFKQMNVEMPPLVADGLLVANFATQNSAYFGIGFAGIVALVIGLLIRYFESVELDCLRLRVPIFGRLLRRAVVARYARLLSSLLIAGIGIVAALEATIPALDSPLYEREIRKIAQSLQDGGTIADGLKGSPWFESLAVHLVAVGEETGRLDDNLSRLADVYEREVSEELATVVALIEPITIVIVGLVVGAIVIAIFVPLYSLIGGVK